MGEPKTVIYEPPTRGFPYIVVIVQGEERHVRWAPTRKEAREIAIAEEAQATVTARSAQCR